MAIAMFMEWNGVTAESYEAVRNKVKWETDIPHGTTASPL